MQELDAIVFQRVFQQAEEQRVHQLLLANVDGQTVKRQGLGLESVRR